MRKLFFTILILFSFASMGRAATITVGDGKTHATIQAAINAASSTDTIEVYTKAATSNVYAESIDENGLNTITLIGMVANQGITIDGTGIAQLAGGENVRISGVTGWTIQNFTLKDNDNATLSVVRFGGGSGHTLTKCKLSSTITAATQIVREVALWTSTGCTITQNVFESSISGNQYHQLTLTEGSNNATVKYNDFGGTNVYLNLYLGTTDNSSNSATVQYNYFHSSMSLDWLGIIYVRDTSGHSIKYNLVIPSSVAHSGDYGKAASIVLREDNCINNDIQHNTVVFPSTGLNDQYESIILYYDDVEGNAGPNVVKNNIFQGGSYTHNGMVNGSTIDSITYNYHYNPQDDYQYNCFGGFTFTNYANNTETLLVAPGFAGSGTVWETDGTDVGTSSTYYRLTQSAPARTTGEGGTYCGAFSSGNTLTLGTGSQSITIGGGSLSITW